MRPPDLLLLCATPGEADDLARAFSPPDDAPAGRHAGSTPQPAPPLPSGRPLPLLQGLLEGHPCRLLYGGIGPVNTAHALTAAVERRRPALVLQLGVCGAFVPAGLPVGAVALASEEIYGDLGVLTPQGWQPADLIGIPVVAGDPPRFNRFPLDPALVERALRALEGGLPAGSLRRGPFLTRSQVTGVRALGDVLYRRFGALCESMEGAAAAHVCALYGLPFLEVRGVSNLVEDRDRARWRLAPAAAAAQAAVRRLVAQAPWLLGEEDRP